MEPQDGSSPVAANPIGPCQDPDGVSMGSGGVPAGSRCGSSPIAALIGIASKVRLQEPDGGHNLGGWWGLVSGGDSFDLSELTYDPIVVPDDAGPVVVGHSWEDREDGCEYDFWIHGLGITVLDGRLTPL